MKPKFTDTYRLPPGGYVPSIKTDVAKTFARIRKQLAEQAKIDAKAQEEIGSSTPKTLFEPEQSTTAA